MSTKLVEWVLQRVLHQILEILPVLSPLMVVQIFQIQIAGTNFDKLS